MHQKSLGQTTDINARIHSVEGKLLLPHHPTQIFLGQIHELFQLPDSVVADLARGIGNPRVVKQPLGFFVVCPGQIQRVLQRGFMFESRFVFHESILGTFPG